MTADLLHPLATDGLLSDLDRHFARLMVRLSGGETPEVGLAAALVSRSRRMGHVCLNLPDIAGHPPEGSTDAPPLPQLASWREALRRSRVVGAPGDVAPLVLDRADRLYLYRYWAYQEELAEGLLGRGRREEDGGEGAEEGEEPAEQVSGLMDRFFPREEGDERQRRAAEVALNRRLCVISGGPGTGKTTTVARILALLIGMSEDSPPDIALAAPTGKAAARMQEAIRREKARPVFEGFREVLPESAVTLHRLLGTRFDSPYFRHNRENPLPADTVVVDEASMVDLALMAKLVEALRPGARLILLGDRDQLASVEAGAVLGDICNTGGRTDGTGDGGIRGCIVQLETSYRFGGRSGIGAVSRAVNKGDGDGAIGMLRSGEDALRWGGPFHPDAPQERFREAVIEGYRPYLTVLDDPDPDTLFRRFDRFRILCGLRRGPFGAAAVNRTMEAILAKAGLIRPTGAWYPGRPVMITRNDYGLGLFNGDVGIALRDRAAAGEIRVFFPTADGGVRRLHPLRLPGHETVYAMTVHKSQGSEFDRVLLLLPDRDAPVLTRELLYTGLTRARESVFVWSDPSVFRQAAGRRTVRSSGLRDALWGGGA